MEQITREEFIKSKGAIVKYFKASAAVCPVCHNEVDFIEGDFYGDDVLYWYECSKCNLDFRVCYKLEFKECDEITDLN